MFRHPIFLIYYDSKRRLYIDVDGLKVMGFRVIIYYFKNESFNLS